MEGQTRLPGRGGRCEAAQQSIHVFRAAACDFVSQNVSSYVCSRCFHLSSPELTSHFMQRADLDQATSTSICAIESKISRL
jgi:hypothetical protein